MATKKEAVQAQLERLQAHHASPEFGLILDWLKAKLEVAKDDLLASSPDTLALAQAEAKAIQRLIRELERPNLKKLNELGAYNG